MTSKRKTNTNDTIKPLTQNRFKQGVLYLCHQDSDLEKIVSEFGPPVFKYRENGFTTLVRIILEQQVSLASAAAVYRKLLSEISKLTPKVFLKLDDIALKSYGFSRQKTMYCRNLADAILGKSINFKKFEKMDDPSVRAELTKIKGVGIWTADIYLLTALQRQDIWPSHDLALAIAIKKVKKLDTRPCAKEMNAIGSHWKPWRTVAARLLWHYYLSQ